MFNKLLIGVPVCSLPLLEFSLVLILASLLVLIGMVPGMGAAVWCCGESPRLHHLRSDDRLITEQL